MAVREVLRGLGERGGQSGFHVVEPTHRHWLGQLDQGAVGGLHTGGAEVAAVVAFLAGPDAGFLNGVHIPVDGGLTASNGQTNLYKIDG